MGDLESLLLVLAVIYLTECLVWVRRGAVAVASYWGKRWRFWHPGAVLGNSRGATFLANPLPPFGAVVVGYQFPISASPQAVYSFTAASINPGWRPSQVGRLVRYDELRTVTFEGKNVLTNDALFCRAPSAASARRLAEWLHTLKLMPEAQRSDAIRTAVADALDPEKVRARWSEYRDQSKLLQRLSTVLFAYLFFAAPALLWSLGFRVAGIGVAAGLLVQTFTIGWLFHRAHRRLYPNGAEDRFVPFLTMLLAPPTAIRARDLLARHLMDEFHPLAVTQVLCSRADLKAMARHALRDLYFPMLPLSASAASDAIQTEGWFRRLVLDETEKLLTRAGLNPVELLAPPVISEEVHRAYCPRCHAQFVSADVVCGDCGGRPVAAFGMGDPAGAMQKTGP
jgi:hypothetical protein